MKPNYFAGALVALFSLAAPSTLAQLSVTAVNTDFTVDFDNGVTGVNNGQYAGAGFEPTPIVGRLDSDAIEHTGMSNGDLSYGGTGTTNDDARGVDAGVTGTGGFYAFQVGGPTDHAFGIQPGGSDWTPGTVTLRVQNNTGVAVTDIDIAYEIWELNDQPRANSLNFSWSDDDVTYTPVGALDFTSTEVIGALVWLQNDRSTSVSGLNIPNGGYFYLRWTGDDVSGSGGRDEFAIDDIVVNMNPLPPYPTPPGSGDALDFDGVDDFVDCGNFIQFNTPYTVEAWINTTVTGAWQSVVTKYQSGIGGSFWLDVNAAGLLGHGHTATAILSTTNVADGSWHHVAITFDGTSRSMYIDGVLEASGLVTASPVNAHAVVIGSEQSPGFEFLGNIDETRFWNVALTEAEIRDHMCQKDLSAHPQIANLAAYYRMDDGTGSGTLQDLAGVNDGILTNMDPAADWVTSGAPIGDESSVVFGGTSLTHTGTDGELTISNFNTGTANFAIYKVNEAPNVLTLPSDFASFDATAGYFGVTSLGTPAPPTYHVNYDFSGNVGMSGQTEAVKSTIRMADRADNADNSWERTTSYINTLPVNNTVTAYGQSGTEYILGYSSAPPYPTPPGSGDALDFDGVDDHVVVPNDASLNPGMGNFSIEAWFKSSTSSPATNVYLFSKNGLGGVGGGSGGNENDWYYLTVFSGTGTLGFGQHGPLLAQNQTLTGTTNVADQEWHHVVAVRDVSGGTVRLYVDGILDASAALTMTAEIAPSNDLLVGAWESTGGSANQFWPGQIDEARIWNGVALTQTEIRDYMCQKDLSAHPQIANLAAYYRMDDGTGSGTLQDLAGVNDGILTNMDPATDWVTSGAPIGDGSAHTYGGGSVSYADGTSMTADTYTGSPTAVHVYKVNEAPNDVTVPGGFTGLETSEYYGVHVIGGTAPTYTASLTYTANGNINGQPNEAQARLASRTDNAGGAFADIATQTINTGLNIISATGQTGTEYVPGFGLSTEVQFQAPTTSSVSEGAGTTVLTLEIANPSGSNATDVDVVLISGNAARINGYTTQNVSWAAGDGTDKTVIITLTDDPACNGDEVLVFELQSINGGNSATLGANTQFTLTVTDDLSMAQMGLDIDGEAADDQSGYAVAFSADGDRVAIGALNNDGTTGNNGGHVRLYDWNGSSWVQVGTDIDGEAVTDNSGVSVALSADGNRVAIGAIGNDDSGSNAGHVRLYDWNGSAWVQVGADIDGEAAGDQFGRSVALSADGSRIAIGANMNDGAGPDAGHVRLYDWNGSAWVQAGADIDGEIAGDQSGRSVALSANGNRVAIGASLNDGTGTSAGHVRLYDWNGSAWVQVGADIDGEAANDQSGWSVSLSTNGNRVAIGATGNDDAGSGAGHVRFYDWNGSAWVQAGADIDGEAGGDNSGRSVSLSANGNRVAIGANGNDGAGLGAGHVRLYDWNGSAWVQAGTDIDGEVAGDLSGWSVALSGAGSRVAIGARSNAGTGAGAGHVRVYGPGVCTEVQFQAPISASFPENAGTTDLTLEITNPSGSNATDVDVVLISGNAARINGYTTQNVSWAAGDATDKTVTITLTDDPLCNGDEILVFELQNVNGGNSATFGANTQFTLTVTDYFPLVQMGMDIDGEAADDTFGYSVSMSADGSRIVVGARNNDGNGVDAGHVRVYDWNGSAWVQVGADIDGEAANDQSGHSVSISSDGSRVAIGARRNNGAGTNVGHVRVFDWNGVAWIQVGTDIDGEASFDEFGSTLDMSSDGNRVAIGAQLNDGNGISSGHVRIYDWNGSSWIQVGSDIDGEAVSDNSGTSVSISADGNKVAIGAKGNDDNGAQAGHVRVYEWNGSVWVQVGSDIDGEAAADGSGTSVSLAADGDRVAIGAILNDGNGASSGHVRIYDWNGSAWVQAGSDIDGESAGDGSGASVSMSSDGSLIAIGAYTNDGAGSNAGHVRLYSWNGSNWVQLGFDIDGEAAGDLSGWSNSMSSDGSRIAIGARDNAGNGSNSGHVRVFGPGSCTEVQFQGPVSASVPENAGTTDLTLEIDMASGSPVDVDVVLISGDAARINNYTTQTVNWPAADGADKTLTITLTDDPACTGDEVLVFELQNQVNALLGTNTQFTLTVTDDQTISTTFNDDFESGSIAGWQESNPGDWAASTTAPINGTYSLKHNLSGVSGFNYVSNAVQSDLNNGDNTWRFQLKNGSWDPSGGNRFWFWLAANDADLSSAAIDGYVVGVNYNGTDDLIKLWRVDNNGGTAIITSSFDWDADDVVGIEVTRNTAGLWELLVDTDGGFDALVSEGTVTDIAYTTMSDLGAEFDFTTTRAGQLWIDDISYNQSSCQLTYYSQASGNISDPIWDLVPVGVAGPATFDQTTSMVIQDGHSVNNDQGTFTVKNFELEDLGTLTTDDDSNDGLIAFGFCRIETSAHPTLSISLRGIGVNMLTGVSLYLKNVTCGSTGVDFNNTSLTLTGELNVTSGDFNMNDNPLILSSDVNGTALIGDLSGGSLSNATKTKMQRYIPGGVTNWRNLGTPVIGKTLEHWDWDFVTSGIPNSDFPNFTDDNGDIWPSIYLYDEGLAAAAMGGPAIDTGFVAPGDMNDLFISGAGYWVWCGDQLGGTAPFTIDVVGTPNVGPQALPLQNSLPLGPSPLELANMGWNMVSNPLPSPVDFTGIALAGSIENRYWIYDPVTGNTALWDEASSTSIPALVLNGNIQSSQGMWMHAFNQGPISAVVPETAKIDDASANGVFGGFIGNTDPAFRVEISSTMNSMIDEVLVRFTPNGSPSMDAGDAVKLFYSFPDAPMLSTRNMDDVDLIMNDMGTIALGMEIPVSIKTPVYGTYTIRLHDLVDATALGVFVLEDLQTGAITAMTEGATYTFTSSAGDLDPRFLIHAPQPEVVLALNAFLEGPYDAVQGLMTDDLRAGSFLPSTEPFTALGFTQVNGGGETIDPGVLNATGNDAIVDWVLVELRDADNTSIIVSTASALIQRDGDVVGMNGVDPVKLVADDGEYNVAIRHRNHLGTMTMNSYFLSSTAIVVDFTDASVATYGSEAQKVLNGGVRVLWSGNVVTDNAIKYTGISNDRDQILNAIGGSVPTNTISGYLLEDVDMDGEVKYTGTDNDRDPILINIGGTVPTNVRVEQLP